MTHIIAIANAKGGVAKTTTTLSVGSMLAEAGQQVLLVDLDPHANLTISLGMRPPSLDRTIADVLLGAMVLDDVLYSTCQDGLRLVPSNHDLQLAESHLIVRENFELSLHEALNNSSSL